MSQFPGYNSTPPPPSSPYGGSYGAPYGQQPPMGNAPPNYLVWAILTTIFCCLPFGIASIVFAAQVDGKFSRGDYQGAAQASKNAKMFAIIAAVAGAIGILIFVMLSVVGSQVQNQELQNAIFSNVNYGLSQ